MVSDQEVTVREATAAEVLPFVVSAMCYATAGERRTAQDIAENGHCFVLDCGGAVVAGYVLQQFQGQLCITAAGGAGRFDLGAIIDAIVTRQAAEFEHVTFKTTRRGAVRKAQRLGFEIEAYIMRKKIK
jgi:hypothetical protein